MAELMFGMGQTKAKKQTEAKIRTTKSTLKDVNITETIETNVRSDQHKRDEQYKADARTTKANLKDVTQGETGIEAVRKEQHERDQKWKETGREQVKKNSNFDMARSLFGGGS